MIISINTITYNVIHQLSTGVVDSPENKILHLVFFWGGRSYFLVKLLSILSIQPAEPLILNRFVLIISTHSKITVADYYIVILVFNSFLIFIYKCQTGVSSYWTNSKSNEQYYTVIVKTKKSYIQSYINTQSNYLT